MSTMRIAAKAACLPALGLAAALAFGPDDAVAQGCPTASPPATLVVPPGTPLDEDNLRRLFRAFPPLIIPWQRIECWYDGVANRAFMVRNPRIVVDEPYTPGIDVWVSDDAQVGHMEVYVHGVDPQGRPLHYHPTDLGNYAVRTIGGSDADSWEYALAGDSPGIRVEHEGEGRAGVDFRDLSLSTTGDDSFGIHVKQWGLYGWDEDTETAPRGRVAVVVNVIETQRDRAGRVRPLLGTRGDHADAIRAEYVYAAAYGHIAVTVEGYTVATGGIVPLVSPLYEDGGSLGVEPPRPTGHESRGVYAYHTGRGDIYVKATDSEILTWGEAAQGIYANHVGRRVDFINEGDGTPGVTSGGGTVDVDLTGGVVRTTGEESHGVWGRHRGKGNVDVDLSGTAIATSGRLASGVFGLIQQRCDVLIGTDTGGACPSESLIEGTGVGDIDIDVTGGSIATEGGSAHAVWARHENAGDVMLRLYGPEGQRVDHSGLAGDVSIRLAGGATATTKGTRAYGIYATRGIRTVSSGSSRDTQYETGGDLAITVTGGASVATEGYGAHGVYGFHAGGGDLAVSVTDGASVSTRDVAAHGIFAYHRGGAGTVSVTVTGGSVTTAELDSIGILVSAPRDTGASGGGDASAPADRHERVVRVTVGAGASVTGDTGIQISGGATGAVAVDGTVTGGQEGPAIVLVDGGSVTVGADGRVAGGRIGHAIVSGLQGGDEAHPLAVRIDGRVDGRIVVQDGGDLTLTGTKDGQLNGDVVLSGGRLTDMRPAGAAGLGGTLYNPQSPYTIDKSFGRVVFDLPRYAAGATVTIAPTGRLVGVKATADAESNLQAIVNDEGNLEVELQAGEGESAASATGRIAGTIETAGGEPAIYYRPAGAERQRIGVANTVSALTFGAWDVGVAREDVGVYRLESYYAPRARVYEALPSLLLGLNRVATWRERMTAPRGARGSWARVLAEGGEYKARRSTAMAAGSRSAGIGYDYTRYGVQAGLDLPLTDCDCDQIGVSMHYRHGTAELPPQGGMAVPDGRIIASGFGFAVSGARRLEGGDWDGAYVDGQVAATWYGAKLESGLRGLLKSGARGFGWAASVEAGREMPIGVADDAGVGTVTPRARLVYSQVGVTGFTDQVDGSRVAIEQGRSLVAQLGVGLDAGLPFDGAEGWRMFGGVDLEGALVGKTRTAVTAAGARTPLESEAPGVRARLELGLSHEAADGRVAARGAAHIETAGGGSGYGGEVSVRVRF